MQSLIKWDQLILKQINAEWHNSFLDWLLPFLRNSDMWVPLYFFLLLFGLINFKKTGWWWVLAAVSTAILGDLISSHLIKPNFFRVRPCHEPAIADWIRILPGLYRPQSSSFTSSHATNHFAMAMFFYATLKDHIGKWALLFFIWAAVICYAQMYVGVHYPTDIIAGALIGLMIGYSTSYFFNRKWGLS
jgi:undecaprenyl-diphosphatase